MKDKAKIMRIVINSLIVILACVLLYSVYQLYSIWQGYNSNQKTQSQVQDLFYGETEQKDEIVKGEDQAVSGEQEYVFDLGKVIEANEDTVGWIKIDDTVIDYVVVQGADNDEYLYQGFYGEYNSAGTLFMDYRNQIGGERQNYIIYGHRMKDGSMFGELGKYLEYGFYQSHPTFTFITADGEYECEIFSAYRCTAEVDYCQPSFGTTGEMMEYINECKERAEHKVALDVMATDTLLTLSTCDYDLDPDYGRLVVHARLGKKIK